MNNLQSEWDSAQPVNTQSEWDAATPVSKDEWDSAIPERPKEEGFMSRLGSDFDTRINNASALKSNPDMTEAERRLGYAGQGLGMGADVLKQGMRSAYNILPDAVKKGVGAVGEILMETPLFGFKPSSLRDTAKMASETYGEFEKEYPRIANPINAIGNAVDLGMGLQMMGAALPETATVKALPVNAIQKAKSIKQAIAPTPTTDEALGQILQGGTKDYAKGAKALSVVDLNGVKTYEGLNKKLSDAIPEYSTKVDNELLKDRGVYKLEQLGTEQSTKPVTDATGKVIIPSENIKVNFVEDALNQLSELYGKIGEKGLAKDAENTLEKANVAGLSKKEVNDLARQYNVEFGDKAFGKGANHEPLTSVSAQAYENTRQGLKEVARRGLSDTAKELDSTMSSIFNTKSLIEKNVEAVNKLRQKVDQRGLGEKIGRGILTAIDAATMGIVKGAALKFIPRGMGYKTKNWLDLEESLGRNLSIIEKANAAKSDAELVDTIRRGFASKGFQQANVIPERPSVPAFDPRNRPDLSGGVSAGQPHTEMPRPAPKMIEPDYIDAEFRTVNRPSALDIPRRDPTLALPAGQGFTKYGENVTLKGLRDYQKALKKKID